jgi:sporulation protein YlmC with PRC-barrel domain
MAMAAVDALQHVNVAMVQPQFQISRNTHRAGELLCVRKSSLSLTEQTHSEAQMLKTLMMSAAVSTLMVSGALAQANPPAAPPAAPAAKADAAPVDSAKFIQAQGTDQWVFSKFKGTDVIGPDNAQVGDVNDVLFDKGGKIIGLIVGVGGFLGIGEKSVAIDMSAFEPVPAETGSSTAGGNSAVSSSNDPTNVKLKVSWTKDQLKSAPDFQYYKAPARTTERPAASPTTGMAPRPATPGAER